MLWAKRRTVVWLVVLASTVLLTGVASAAVLQQSHAKRAPVVPAGCSDFIPCPLRAGTYRLGNATVLPGLQMKLPRGWSSTENTFAEFKLMPAGQRDDALHVWLDMYAVKSTGPGHGTTILRNVGRTPDDMVAWLTQNPDFLIASQPTTATIAGHIPSTTLSVGVSTTANYGDPGCPSNPRCADLFTTPRWGSNNWFAIGGDGEVRLYIAAITKGGRSHTFWIALEAPNDAQLLRLTAIAKPVLSGLRLPKGVTAG